MAMMAAVMLMVMSKHAATSQAHVVDSSATDECDVDYRRPGQR